jgi:peptide subunit release factor 1 (eRF1)
LEEKLMKKFCVFSENFTSEKWTGYLIFEPFKPISKTFYRCSNKFHLDSISEMYTDDIVYGIVYTDGKECISYSMNSLRYTIENKTKISLQGQFKKGGQSAQRLERIRDENRGHYLDEIAEKITSLFYSKENSRIKIKYLILVGPGQFKFELSQTSDLKKFFGGIIHILTMDNLDKNKVNNFIEEQNQINEREVKKIEDLKLLIQKADDKLVFGNEILELLNSKQLGILYIDSTLELPNFEGYDLEIVKVSPTLREAEGYLLQFGGMVGVKWY